MSTRAALALTQASWRTAKSYRFSFVLSFVSLAVTIVPVYFVANALQPFMASVISSEGREYFGFVLIGTAMLTLVSAALSSFAVGREWRVVERVFRGAARYADAAGPAARRPDGLRVRVGGGSRGLLLVGAGSLLGVDVHWLRLPEALLVTTVVVVAPTAASG